MTLLEEIQNEAVDSNSDVAALLRKCKLLAARLHSNQLANWVEWELNGYPEAVEVPEYRIWTLQVKGHFAGPFGASLNAVSVPTACLPKGAQDSYQNYRCRQSIASLELMIKSGGAGSLRVSTSDLSLVLGTKVYQGYNCLEAWAEFGTGALVEVTNAVRNRILDFAIALWKEAPEAGDASGSSHSTIEPTKLTQIFNTTVYGGAANVLGSAHDSKIEFNIPQADLEALRKVLEGNGVNDEDIKTLNLALTEEPAPASTGRYGPKVADWISTMIGKAASGVWSIGLGAAGKVLEEALLKFYGLK